MKRRWIVIGGVAAVVATWAVAGRAGENARAIARAYWQVGGAAGCDSVQVATGTPQFVITVRGAQNVRGVDVGLRMIQCDGGPMADAWLGNGTGGCNDGNWSFYPGGAGGFYPSIFGSGGEVPNLVISKNQEFFGTEVCSLPIDHFGYLWLHAEGSGGVARDSTREYAIWAVKFDVRGRALGGPTDCAGDLSDPSGAKGVYLYPCNLSACGSRMAGGFIALLDGNGELDYVPVNSAPRRWRTGAGCSEPLGYDLCSGWNGPRLPPAWGKTIRTAR